MDFVLPEKLIIGDYSTRYTGYYSSNGFTAHITNVIGNGSPFLYFFGFSSKLLGKKVIVQVDRDGLGFREKEFTIQQFHGEHYYNLDGTYLGTTPIGIFVNNWGIPKGEFNFTFKYQKLVSKMKLIKNF
ncbi:hypothetical protein IO417_000006 [Campylobacter lari]|uniref:hypothetical protein n=1 Tax=Campylobacter lari TaxID=201 RepID=UPI0012776078|nr:hypothetical protein [Campylobacter lari]EAK0794203.1 hypothetical protein [Campylobacter lari]EAK0795538.1 hypothetical protein [Campylobacter lari]EAK5585224.1 hypothetical protein [Campylobacter lari]EGK8020487.1 hypothetical protein [Campylobacter lari]